MDYNFRNNAGEEFKFFLNEKNNPCLNIRYEQELIAAFILSKEELKNLIVYLQNINKEVDYEE